MIRTAIHRTRVSAPLRWLLDNGLIVGSTCNWGEGYAYQDTIAMNGEAYDPNSKYLDRRVMPTRRFDTIYCGYVLNTLTAPEALDVMITVRNHLHVGGTAYFAVRTDKIAGTPFEDGVITKRGTFQCSYKPYLPKLNVIHRTGHYAIFV
jgi:hypothetical protein